MSELPRRLGVLVLLLVALALPLVLEDFWLQLGLFVMATMVGAVGLTLLVGVAGQLSLGHAAFAAIGAYVYVWATSESTDTLAGAGLPSVVGLLLAVGGAALVGFVFSPVASRLRGIYLGLATLGLVFIVRHLLLNLDAWTGGFNGRTVEPFTIGGFSFSNKSPDYLAVAGVEFQGLHRLWYLFLVLTLVAAWLAGEPPQEPTGRAWANVRDSETAAAAMGIAVARHKARRSSSPPATRGSPVRSWLWPTAGFARRVHPDRLRRLPGNDRAGRSRLGRRRHGRGALRHRTAAGADAVQRLAAVPGRPGLRRPGPGDGGRCCTGWRSSPS